VHQKIDQFSILPLELRTYIIQILIEIEYGKSKNDQKSIHDFYFMKIKEFNKSFSEMSVERISYFKVTGKRLLDLSMINKAFYECVLHIISLSKNYEEIFICKISTNRELDEKIASRKILSLLPSLILKICLIGFNFNLCQLEMLASVYEYSRSFVLIQNSYFSFYLPNYFLYFQESQIFGMNQCKNIAKHVHDSFCSNRNHILDLELDFNHCREFHIDKFVQRIHRFSELKALCLVNANLKSEDAVEIYQALSQLPGLQLLDLSGNFKIGNQFLQIALPKDLYSDLRILRLDKTQIDHHFDLSQFKKLSCLILRGCSRLNELFIEKLTILPQLVKTLKILDLSYNEQLFYKVNIKSSNELLEDVFMDCISKLKSLEQLMIMNCLLDHICLNYVKKLKEKFKNECHRELKGDLEVGSKNFNSLHFLFSKFL